MKQRVQHAVRGFYGIVDWQGADCQGAVNLARQLIAGGAKTLQLRMKRADTRDLLWIGEALRSLCRQEGRLFVVNDRLDVAMALGAEAVHLGQDDIPIESARRICGHGMIIGISTHNEQQARAAEVAGADYIGVGPVFSTASKENPDPVVGIARLSSICRVLKIPVVAIGGIDTENIFEVVRTGVRAAAVISAVNGAKDPRRAAQEISSTFPSGI